MEQRHLLRCSATHARNLTCCAVLIGLLGCPGSERGADAGAQDESEATMTDAAEMDGAPEDLPEAEVITVDVLPDAVVLDPVSSLDAGADADASMEDETGASGSDGDAARDAGAADGGGADGGRFDQDGAPGQLASAVDLLFMVDNSGSMSEEQVKLAAVLDDLVLILTSGRYNPADTSGAPDFRPIESLHIGVVSSDMGVNGAPPQKSCGTLSFLPDERDTAGATQFLVKPMGDDGLLQTSTKVAVAGVYAAVQPGATQQLVVPGDPTCASVVVPPGRRFLEFRAGSSDPQETAHAFNCIARLGKNGCGLEQQLESVLKALTPPDSPLKFTSNSNGQGSALQPTTVGGGNAGFLRDDALLVVVIVSDEEDCSSPDASRDLYDPLATTIAGEINVRCGLAQNQAYLHNVQRYAEGLRALKTAAHQDHIVVASLVGIPLAASTGAKVHMGASSMSALLARTDMEFRVQRNVADTADEPVPACISPKDGSAAPGRRFLELSRQFGDNALVGSICEDEFGTLLNTLIQRIVAQF